VAATPAQFNDFLAGGGNQAMTNITNDQLAITAAGKQQSLIALNAACTSLKSDANVGRVYGTTNPLPSELQALWVNAMDDNALAADDCLTGNYQGMIDQIGFGTKALSDLTTATNS
jgi:hypothetical protein